MTKLISYKRQIISIGLSWIIFIGIDFLFHASIFSNIWREEIPALKPLKDLALLIPAGYFSFLLLTFMIGYIFFKIFRTKPTVKSVIQFGFIFALLFALSNFFGLFSFVALPVKQLMVFNLIYFVELMVVSLSLYYIAFLENLKRSILYAFCIFFGLIIIGIVLQNIPSFKY